jgi:hypothetical protein
VQCGDISLHAVAVTVLQRCSEKIGINPNFAACSCSNDAVRGRFNDKIKIRTEAAPDPLLFRVGFRERVWKLKESIKGGGSPFLVFLLIFQQG